MELADKVTPKEKIKVIKGKFTYEPDKVFGDWRDDYKKINDYSVKSKGVYRNYEKEIKGEMIPQSIQLSNFIARIAKVITRDDGQEQKTDFEIDGFLASGKPLPVITIGTADFDGMKWVVDKWHGDANISPVPNVREYLRHSIQEVSQYTKTNQTIYNYTGWRKINNEWAYLHAGGAIGADAVTVDLTGEGNLNRYELPKPNKELAKESARMALKILSVADLKITVPLLSLIYLSPLCEPLKQAGKEPDFVVWVQAKTQSMKSSFSAVLLSHFGKGFDKNTLTASFKGTANSIEKIGYTLKDTVTVVDDFHPSSSRLEAVKMTQTAQMIMRAWGDRTGRSRCNVDGTLRKTYPPRGMCLVTGEDIPDVGESGLARLFLVPLNRGDIDSNKLSELQDNLDLLGQNMANYIDWIRPQIDDIAKVASRGLGQIRDNFNQCHNLQGRSPETLSFLTLGFDTFLRYCESVGELTADERVDLFDKGQNALIELSCSYAEKIAESKPKEQFFTALKELMISQMVEILPLAESPKIGNINFIGWTDLEYYYLMPETTYKHIIKFYNEMGVNFPVSKNRLWQDLADDGHITAGKDQVAKVKKINNKSTRVIWLKYDDLQQKE